MTVSELPLVEPACDVPFGPDAKIRNVFPGALGDDHVNVTGSVCDAPSAGEISVGGLFVHDELMTVKLRAAESSGVQLPLKFARTRHFQLPTGNVAA